MRELSTPSLFDPSTAMLAKEFVRWCFSFGSDFRNTPDVVNLRTWAQKTKLKLKDSEENEVLIEASRVYLKRIEQMMKKSDPGAEAPGLQDSTPSKAGML